MTAMQASPATCSAPGKVLLTGGYLILDRPHAGMVLALNARFASVVEPCTFGDAAATACGGLLIEVRSPQFHDERRYVYRWDAPPEDASLELQPPPSGGEPPSPNRYVEVPLLYGLTLLRYLRGDGFLKETLGDSGARSPSGVRGLRITLGADNGFYSQAAELRARGWELSAESLAALPPYLPPRRDADGELPKTGLGSSATLVTSLLGALLHAFGLIALPNAPECAPHSAGCAKGGDALGVLHAVAQLCHCAAQGKVGSGFDVCAAVYGSNAYVRFSPSLLAPLLALPTHVPPPRRLLLDCVCAVAAGGGAPGAPPAWDHSALPFETPPGVEVMMADVSCGANTPSMVKKILAWRKAGGAADVALWEAYAQASVRVQASVRALCALHAASVSAGAPPAEWARQLTQCGCAPPEQWSAMGEVGSVLCDLRRHALSLRTLIREISAVADVPIEPPSQTELLDATMRVRGVLVAVVPGAGGNDAVVALVLPTTGAADDPQGTRARVAALWRAWPQVAPPPAPSVVCELCVKEARPSATGHNGVMWEV